MSFRFNFSGGNDSDSEGDSRGTIPTPAKQKFAPAQTPPKYHSLEDLIRSLPQNISYSSLTVSPSISIPRRELYDVRMQLMAEDRLSDDGEQTGGSSLVGLGDEDIRTSFYEGGLKSWECSVDLVRHLASDKNVLPGVTKILELGCGTSLPSLYLFQTILQRNQVTETLPYHFTLTDYNFEVLRLVTFPNLLLSWGMHRAPTWEAEGDLGVSESLIAEFLIDLERLNITIDFISGGWGKGMLELFSTPYDLVLASETIYSPTTTELFTDVLLGGLERGSGRGLVAAKQIYFGVGGGVADFVRIVKGRSGGGWEARVVREERDVGVGRNIVEVSSRSG